MKALLLVTVVLVAAVHMVSGRSAGAPLAACRTLTPQHNGNVAQRTQSPHIVDLSDFNFTMDEDTGDTTFYYVPDTLYAITLRATGVGMFSDVFRGFLLQGRAFADGSVVGTFMDASSNNDLFRLSSCDRSDGAVTHNSGAGKTEITVYWMSPTNGTGPIYFGHAFVWRFNTFWANLRTAPLLEVGGDNELPDNNNELPDNNNELPDNNNELPDNNNEPGGNSAVGFQAPTSLLTAVLLTIVVCYLL